MKSLSAGVALALCAATASYAGVPFPSRSLSRAEAQDLGRTRELSREPISATVALSVDTAGMERLVTDLYDRQGPHYRKFLSNTEFRARFAPSAETVRRVTADLREEGLSVELLNGTLLRVTGAPEAMERAFGVELHSYSIATGNGPEAIRFHAPTADPQLRASWSGLVDSVIGLDNRPRYRPHSRPSPSSLKQIRTPRATSAPNALDAPGVWSVQDFATYYNVNSLYKEGVTGKGATIGIVTLAAFTPSDVFAYWNDLGLPVNKNRLKVVNIDNGPGAPSDDSGSLETTIDVSQSGGVAPGANLIVYQAPNDSGQGFVDAYAQALADNRADVISVSWGDWEVYIDESDVNDPSHPKRSINQVTELHNLFIQAALQGQSLFAAAGDSGAYDLNGDLPLPQFPRILTVDHPASDPYMTAAGGTTLPGRQVFAGPKTGSTITVNIPQERAWSWDYLDGLCAAFGYDPVSCGIFPVGGGGGVSVLFGLPGYQENLHGVTVSAPGQKITDTTQTPPVTYKLPAGFAGRNVPDISANADPYTGYYVLYTSDQTGFGEQDGWGGTSFVAPQLAGVTALVDVVAGGRVGLLNFPLYGMARFNGLYSGRNPAARDITSGNNEFYQAGEGYDPASGLGVLNVANFANSPWFQY